MNVEDYMEALQDAELSDLSSWPYWLKVFSVLFLGGVILFSGYKSFYESRIGEFNAAVQKEAKLKQDLKDKQELAVNLSAYQQQMLEIQDRLSVLLKQLPNQTEIPALLTDISQVGKERGLEFKRFKPLEATQRGFYVELLIEIQASGTYHQLASFVSDIAGFERVVTIGNIDMQRVNSNRDENSTTGGIPLSFNATLHTYHYDDEKVVAK